MLNNILNFLFFLKYFTQKKKKKLKELLRYYINDNFPNRIDFIL